MASITHHVLSGGQLAHRDAHPAIPLTTRRIGAAGRLIPLLAALLLAGCVNPKVRPWADVRLLDHTGGDSRSSLGAGVSFVSETGLIMDVGPTMDFDFGGNDGPFGNAVVGGAIRLRYVR